MDELEKIVNGLREKRETEKRKFRPELGNDSPAPSQFASITVTTCATPTLVQSEASTSAVIVVEETNQPPPVVLENKLIKKQEPGNSQESSKQSRHHRRKRGSTASQ